MVRMDQDWTRTGVSCEEGDTIRISARGEGVYDETEAAVGPNGLTTGAREERRVFRNIESFALIGLLDTQSEAFFVGVEQQYVCPSSGELLLGPNDNLLDGNRGGWTVTLQLDEGA